MYTIIKISEAELTSLKKYLTGNDSAYSDMISVIERVVDSCSDYEFFICFRQACVLLNKPIGLAAKAYNNLRRGNILITKLDAYTDQELLKIRNFGPSQLEISRRAFKLMVFL